MRASPVLAALVAALSVLSLPTALRAQTIGTFSWQMAPYCNVVTLTVAYDGAAVRLSGYDDSCGVTSPLPVSGGLLFLPGNTYGLTFYAVSASGLPTHVTATIAAAGGYSGTWTDSGGATGSFVFGVPGPAAGAPRPAPTISAAAFAAGSISSAAVADGGISTADLAAGAVTGDKLALPLSRTVSSATALFALTNTGSGSAIAAASTGSGAAFAVDKSGTGNAIDVAQTGSGRGVSVTHGSGPGVFASGSGNAIWGVTTSLSSAGVIGDNTTGEAVVGRSQGGSGVGAVVGRSDGAGYGVRGFNADVGIGVLGQAGIGGGTGIAARFENVNAANASDVVVIEGSGTGDLIQAEQSNNVRFRVSAVGNVTADGGFTGGGADVAEFIDAVDTLEPGDVVEIDPGGDGRFRRAASPASAAVAGVITTRPGVLMNAAERRTTLDDGPALALAGRVPVKASVENGVIRPGDLLVAASLPGHAMKAPARPQPGTVIGKALGRLDATGVVEMLVMLR